MNRQKFIGDLEVIRVKRKGLPSKQILVKLRKPGDKPSWKLFSLDEYLKMLHFRDIDCKAQRDS